MNRKSYRVLKYFNIKMLISTVIFFFITVGYWFYIKKDSRQNYLSINRVNTLKILDAEIDNTIFNRRIFNQPELLEQRIRLFERELYFFRDSPLFKEYFKTTAILDQNFKNIEESFSKKKRLLENFSQFRKELRSLTLIISTMNMRGEFEKILLQYREFKEIYQYVMFYIVNGGEFEELKVIEELVNGFNSSANREINTTMENIKKVLSLTIKLEEINNKIQNRDILKNIKNFENSLIDKFSSEESIENSIFYFLVLVSLLLLAFLTFLFIRDRELQYKLNKLNISLQRRVEKEVKKNREKDKFIFQQAKLASLGEMIGNIAHQWRQPLNNLALTIQDVENALFFDELDEDYVSNMSQEAMKQINYMSSTIDDFRNFFKNDSEKEEFDIGEVIDRSLSITANGLKGSGITLLQDIRDNPKIVGQKNQYIQVLINLIKNAQDIINEREIEKGFIKIAIKQEDNFSYLTVEDSGGGIPNHIIEKIFEPYFTTKHQSVGTGLGLYMSKMTIEQNFNGKLKVENLDSGARFSIIVPTVL